MEIAIHKTPSSITKIVRSGNLFRNDATEKNEGAADVVFAGRRVAKEYVDVDSVFLGCGMRT